MEKQKVYQKIRDIAHQLQKDGATYTRADLAYDLHDLGINNDSAEVGMLVWEACQHFHNDTAIKNVFYDNERKDLLVLKYQIEHLIEENNEQELFPLLQNKLDAGNDSLSALNQAISNVMQNQTGKADTSVLNTIVGTQGIVKARGEATVLFNNYSTLIGHYGNARQQIKSIIDDFVKLRGQICTIYRQYAMTLTDAFGDSIKAVSPDLFDFDTIEWLDVQGMLQNVKLDYDRITEKCSILMSDISESFSQSLKSASNASRSMGNKQAALIVAGLNMISHYVDAEEKTTEVKQELLMLKNSMKHDTTLIKGDLSRLLVIYKTLNDLYIPKSEAFCRFSKQVLTTEWDRLAEALYGDPEIKKLKQQRDELLEQSKALEKDIADAEMNINYYNGHIGECNQTLDSLRPQYDQAKSSKPRKPFFLLNLLTFGSSNKKYNRDIYDWNMACKPVITQFESLQVDVKIDSDELTQQQATLKECREAQKKVEKELKQQNKILMQRIKVSQDIRVKMLPHLEALVKLLKLAREIASSKLDGKLVKTVSISRQDTELSPETLQNISTFAQAVRECAYVDNATIRKHLDAPDGQPSDANNQGDTPATRYSEEDLSLTADAGNQTIQTAINLLESWTQLKAMQNRSDIAAQKYDQELEKLQDAFRANLSDIDNKNAVLRECLKKMNTAQNHEQLKEGLLSLAGNQVNFTEEDWEQFLNGQKTIEL